MKNKMDEFRELRKSFYNAFSGFFYCIKNERNIRIHIVVAIFIFVFSIVFKLTSLEYAVLVLVTGLVLICEIINTSIEALVNLSSPAYDSLAKIAKDVAAGGVFLSSLVAVVVGVILFAKKQKLIKTILLIFSNWNILLIFILILILGIFFIFKSFKDNISNKVFGVEEVKIYKPKKNKKFNFK